MQLFLVTILAVDLLVSSIVLAKPNTGKLRVKFGNTAAYYCQKNCNKDGKNIQDSKPESCKSCCCCCVPNKPPENGCVVPIGSGTTVPCLYNNGYVQSVTTGDVGYVVPPKTGGYVTPIGSGVSPINGGNDYVTPPKNNEYVVPSTENIGSGVSPTTKTGYVVPSAPLSCLCPPGFVQPNSIQPGLIHPGYVKPGYGGSIGGYPQPTDYAQYGGGYPQFNTPIPGGKYPNVNGNYPSPGNSFPQTGYSQQGGFHQQGSYQRNKNQQGGDYQQGGFYEPGSNYPQQDSVRPNPQFQPPLNSSSQSQQLTIVSATQRPSNQFTNSLYNSGTMPSFYVATAFSLLIGVML